MHELSIALSIIDVVQEEAQRRSVRVSAVRLRLGPLSGVIKDALTGAFELAREGTDLAECRLDIDEVPIIAYCPKCLANRPVESIQMLCCAECGTPTPQIISGRELEVAAMEVSDSEEPG